jgi:hypothetical protein
MSEQDPETKLRHALGAAYSSSVAGTPRDEIVNGLRSLIASEEIKPIVADYLSSLAMVVAARTSGARCGCHISQLQLDLLREAVA